MRQLSNEDFTGGFNIPFQDITLVYFKQNNCDGCIKFDPIFYRIEKDKGRYNLEHVQFAVVNLSFNNRIIGKAKKVDIIIDKTPTLILFYETRAYAKLNGPLQEQNIIDFINNVINNVINKNQHIIIPQTNVNEFRQNVTKHSSEQQRPVYMTQLKNKSQETSHIYTEDINNDFFDNWKYLPRKDKPWEKDIMF